MEVQVRPVRADEYRRAGEVVVAAYEALPGAHNSGGYAVELADIHRRVKEAEVFVAADGKDVIGCVTLVPEATSPWAEMLADDEAGIRMLAVEPAGQGRGVGQLLLDACIARAVDLGRKGLFLHSTPWMDAAHRLYERNGFVRRPERDWLPDPEVPLLAFRLDLAPDRGVASERTVASERRLRPAGSVAASRQELGMEGDVMAEIGGTCDERFSSVRDVLAANLESGLDVGASVAVVFDGEAVVDIWGGTIDEKGRPWERDTITNVWSTTKTMTALCALMLADRGELDFHAPVARYWPEFAAAGKEGVEVRHLLSHTAGLSGWTEPMREEDLYDWEKATSLLAAQAPWWEPGTASGYHALTQGYLVGEVVRRVTGQSLGSFFAKEVSGPLGADFHIGLADEHHHRVANVIPPPPLAIDAEPTSVAARTLGNPPLRAEAAWEGDWRRAEIPAANGHGNARSVATIQAVVACGGEVGGVRLLSPAGCEAVFEEQADGTDLVLGAPLRLGIGYGLNSAELPVSPNPRACFWGGWGGSIVVVDLDARMTVAYMMNRMGEGTLGDQRGAGIVLAAFSALASG